MKALFFENKLPKILALKAASLFSKNAALGPFSPTRYAEFEMPELPNERWLKIKNHCCGLCGSDIHFIFMDLDPKCFPAAIPGVSRKYLGHEVVGEVVETGSEVPNFIVGDRVALRIDWPSCFQLEIDPPCPQCSNGNYMLCEMPSKKTTALLDTGGGFSPYMVLHRTQPFTMPDTVPEARAVLLEPAASAVHTVQKAVPAAGDRVLVIGAGTIGLMTTAMVRSLSPEAEIHCLYRYTFQAEAARKLGADEVISGDGSVFENIGRQTGAGYFRGHFGNEILLGGYNVIYDTIGSDATLQNALRWTKGGGHVVLSGINFKPGKIDYTPVWNQEIRLTGINCHCLDDNGASSFDVAADILGKTSLPVEDIVTHRFPMENYRDAIRAFLDKKNSKAIKIVLEH